MVRLVLTVAKLEMAPKPACPQCAEICGLNHLSMGACAGCWVEIDAGLAVDCPQRQALALATAHKHEGRSLERWWVPLSKHLLPDSLTHEIVFAD
jgi:hypothetical protein